MSENFVISGDAARSFQVAEKRYYSVTLTTKKNAKFLQQLEAEAQSL